MLPRLTFEPQLVFLYASGPAHHYPDPNGIEHRIVCVQPRIDALHVDKGNLSPIGVVPKFLNKVYLEIWKVRRGDLRPFRQPEDGNWPSQEKHKARYEP